ncbi:MAG TPA: PLDc N-terminal domain-containing protein [Cyclobacteriaceae bacterium]|nr:PLDc N-terminal domain-containing protein [Cyclobacteriaceae bacterium]
MGRLGTILIIVIDVLAVMDVLRSNRETERKVIWILIIIVLPLLGPLAWYLVSRKIINL